MVGGTDVLVGRLWEEEGRLGVEDRETRWRGAWVVLLGVNRRVF